MNVYQCIVWYSPGYHEIMFLQGFDLGIIHRRLLIWKTEFKSRSRFTREQRLITKLVPSGFNCYVECWPSWFVNHLPSSHTSTFHLILGDWAGDTVRLGEIAWDIGSRWARHDMYLVINVIELSRRMCKGNGTVACIRRVCEYAFCTVRCLIGC